MADSASSNQGSIFSEIRTILLTTLVTGLIWIWAEGESVTRLNIPLHVALPDGRSGAGNLMVDSPQLTDHTIDVLLRFEGSTLALDQAASLRGSTIILDPDTQGLPTVAGPNQVVDLLRAVSASPELLKLGLPLASVEPATLVVTATRLVSKELPVRVELARQVALAGDPIPSAQKIKVRIPEVLASKLPDDTQAVAFITEDQILNLRTEGGGFQNVKAVCRLPSALAELQPVFLQPETLNVALWLRQAIESFKLPTSVPVWFSLPPTEDSSQWRIEVVEKFLSDVTVSGPAELVSRLRPQASGGAGSPSTPPQSGTPSAPAPPWTVKAIVELSSDDLNPLRLAASESPSSLASGVTMAPPGGNAATPALPAPALADGVLTLTKTVVFTGLPSNVTVVGNPTVSVRISRVAPAPSDGSQSPAP